MIRKICKNSKEVKTLAFWHMIKQLKSYCIILIRIKLSKSLFISCIWKDKWDYLLKFIYSEKATTKFCETFTLLLTVCTVVKSKVKISQNFVAFSEYMNFNISAQIGRNLHIYYLALKNNKFIVLPTILSADEKTQHAKVQLMPSTLLQWGQTRIFAFSSTYDVTSGISYDYTSGLLFSNVWHLSRDISQIIAENMNATSNSMSTHCD